MIHTKCVWGSLCDEKSEKILYYGHTLSEILAMKLMLEHFIKKGCRRPTKENSGLKK